MSPVFDSKNIQEMNSLTCAKRDFVSTKTKNDVFNLTVI